MLESKPSLTFAELTRANIKRNAEVFAPCDNWTPMEWGCAMAGEAGEACGALKKLRRHTEGTNSNKDHQTEHELFSEVKKELADTVIYCNLIANKLEFDLGEAIRDKFNEVSERMKSSIVL